MGMPSGTLRVPVNPTRSVEEGIPTGTVGTSPSVANARENRPNARPTSGGDILGREDAAKLVDRDVAPAQDHPDPLAGKFGPPTDRPGDGGSAGPLGHLSGRHQNQADRGLQVRVRDQH